MSWAEAEWVLWCLVFGVLGAVAAGLLLLVLFIRLVFTAWDAVIDAIGMATYRAEKRDRAVQSKDHSHG